ncbi:hypothetical protein LINPERHAP1_LOCUS17217, partial [Linum perenne]
GEKGRERRESERESERKRRKTNCHNCSYVDSSATAAINAQLLTTLLHYKQ